MQWSWIFVACKYLWLGIIIILMILFCIWYLLYVVIYYHIQNYKHMNVFGNFALGVCYRRKNIQKSIDNSSLSRFHGLMSAKTHLS